MKKLDFSKPSHYVLSKIRIGDSIWITPFDSPKTFSITQKDLNEVLKILTEENFVSIQLSNALQRESEFDTLFFSKLISIPKIQFRMGQGTDLFLCFPSSVQHIEIACSKFSPGNFLELSKIINLEEPLVDFFFSDDFLNLKLKYLINLNYLVKGLGQSVYDSFRLACKGIL